MCWLLHVFRRAGSIWRCISLSSRAMKSSPANLNFTTSDLFLLSLPCILIPTTLYLTNHMITFLEYCYLLTLCFFLTLLSFHLRYKTIILSTILFSGIFYLFGPVIMEFVPPMFMPLIQFPYGSNLYPNLESKQFINIKVYENLTIDAVHKVVATINEPVLFRGVIHDSEIMGRRIVDRLATLDQKYMSQQFHARPYDFFRGSRFNASLWSNISEVLKSEHNEYIGFEPLLTNEEYEELFGTKDSSRIIDHSFLSNFKEPLVTTFVHGAGVSTSWSFQLAGKKTWYLWHPRDFESVFNTEWFCRVLLPSQGDEYALFSLPTIRVTVESGDILVFPPLWYHAVATHSGFNMMITFRTKYGNWLPGPIRSLRFFTGAAFVNIFGRNTPHYLTGTRKIRTDALHRIFDESPEALRWESPVNYT